MHNLSCLEIGVFWRTSKKLHTYHADCDQRSASYWEQLLGVNNIGGIPPTLRLRQLLQPYFVRQGVSGYASEHRTELPWKLRRNHVTKDAGVLFLTVGRAEGAREEGQRPRTSTSRAINSLLIDCRRCAPRDHRNVT